METGFYGKANNLLLSHPAYTFISFQARSTHPPKWRGSEYASQVNKELTWRNCLIFQRYQHYSYERGKHRTLEWHVGWSRDKGPCESTPRESWWPVRCGFTAECSHLGAASSSWLGANRVLWTWLVPHGGDVEEELDRSTPAQRLPRKSSLRGLGT